MDVIFNMRIFFNRTQLHVVSSYNSKSNEPFAYLALLQKKNKLNFKTNILWVFK